MGMQYWPGYPSAPGFMVPGQQFPIIQQYPGNQFINSSPAFQFNPSFDGRFAHGTQVNPYVNYLFENVNMVQTALFG
jgi:hypothetical protein